MKDFVRNESFGNKRKPATSTITRALNLRFDTQFSRQTIRRKLHANYFKYGKGTIKHFLSFEPRVLRLKEEYLRERCFA